jgi:hypothetical protein
MRWICFITTFLAIIFCSFWGYLWVYRVEFLATALERSSAPYKISIDSIQIQDSQTIVINNVSIHTKEASPKCLAILPKVTLCSSPASWFYWLLIPSTAPLHLASATLVFSHTSLLSFEQPRLHLILDIDTCVIENPDGTQRTLNSLHLPVAGLLSQATQSHA